MGKIKRVELVKTIYSTRDNFPEAKSGDVAFVGRSNVGKSSLLNTLFERKIAHVSKRPGKTRSINFYLVNSEFYMVDLPGYGYAKVSKVERQKWAELVDCYFKKRWSLKMVYLLIDGRHGVQKNDEVLIEWIRSYGIPFVVILTKMDKVPKRDKKNQVERIKEQLQKYGEYIIIPYSAVTKEGIEEILNSIFTSVEVK